MAFFVPKFAVILEFAVFCYQIYIGFSGLSSILNCNAVLQSICKSIQDNIFFRFSLKKLVFSTKKFSVSEATELAYLAISEISALFLKVTFVSTHLIEFETKKCEMFKKRRVLTLRSGYCWFLQSLLIGF